MFCTISQSNSTGKWTNTKLSWIKAHVGIVGNELADQLAKAAASDSDAKIVFNRLPMSTLISKIGDETKLAKGMGKVYKGRNNKRVFSKGARQAKVKNRYNSNPHSDGYRPRENQGLSPPLQNSGTCKLPLRQRRSNHRTFTKPVFDTAYTERNIHAQCFKVWELDGK